MEPVFVRSDLEYESYTDFWALVKLSGFPIIPTQEADLGRPGLYIFPVFDASTMRWTSERPPGKRTAKAVLWYIERPDSNMPAGTDPLALFRDALREILANHADEVWVSDPALQIASAGSTRLVALGSHQDLATGKVRYPSGRGEIVHIGQRTPRRAVVIEKMREAGLSVLEPGWGDDRRTALFTSSLLIVMDRVEGLHLSSPLRWAVAAAHRIPILSEHVDDPWPLVAGESVLTCPYSSMVWMARWMSGHPAICVVGNKAYEKLCEETTFAKSVEGAVGKTA